MKIPRWAQVLIGVAIVAVFLGIGAIIAVTAWVSQNVVVNSSSARDVDDEFEKVRQRFKGRLPLLEMKDGAPHYVAARAEAAPTQQQQQLSTLHILAWDADDEKLAKVSVPWWVLRLKSGPIRFSSYASGFDDGGVRLTTEDIEKHGPGIIMEVTGRHRERVLLWTE
jgi:hypothetical protein